MSATINVNKRTVVHKSSDGISTAFPDVCKTPSPGGPVPIPYPNIALSKDTAKGSKSVKMDGNPIMLKGSYFSTSTGDEAGSAGGGVVSGKIKGKAEFVNYSFDVKVEGKNVPRLGDMMVQNKGSPPNTPPTPEVQPPLPPPADVIVHASLRIQQISFSRNHVVEKDTTGKFLSPEWRNGRKVQDNSPICYTRDTKVELTAIFKVTSKPTSQESVIVDGKVTIGSTNIIFNGNVSVSPAATEVSVTLTSDINLPDNVDCIDSFEIDWNYNPAGTGVSSAGISSNTLYIVLADPTGTPAYWTLLDISCRSAKGKTTENDVVLHSYIPFKGQTLTRKRDGQGLTYWNPDTTRATNTELLLASANGSGQCGSWAEMLIDMFKCHGIVSAAKVLIVNTLATQSTNGFLVKNWSFIGAGTQPDPLWPYLMYTECISVNGVAGQRNPNPPPAFFNHFIVHHAGSFYDPSYGSDVFSTKLLWENASIDGLFKKLPSLTGYKKSDNMMNQLLEFYNLTTRTKI